MQQNVNLPLRTALDVIMDYSDPELREVANVLTRDHGVDRSDVREIVDRWTPSIMLLCEMGGEDETPETIAQWIMTHTDQHN
jgi:hypothetical protein